MGEEGGSTASATRSREPAITADATAGLETVSMMIPVPIAETVKIKR